MNKKQNASRKLSSPTDMEAGLELDKNEGQIGQFLHDIGRKIAKYRSQQGYTQLQFAKRVGVCIQMVQYWESGRNLTLKTMFRLSQHLDKPLNGFLENSGTVETIPELPASNPTKKGPLSASLSNPYPVSQPNTKAGGSQSAHFSLSPDQLRLRMNLALRFQPKKEPSLTKRMNILVIEDNMGDVRFLLEAFNQDSNDEFNILHEHSLKGALTLLSREKVDLILLDLFLPDGSGLDTLREFQKAGPHAPVIVLTGLYDKFMAESAIKLGADFCLSKGYSEVGALIRALKDYAELK